MTVATQISNPEDSESTGTEGTNGSSGKKILIPIKIPLDLSEQINKTFGSQLSSDNYYGLLLSILMPLDLLYTYFFRYNRLLDVDLPNAGDAGISGTQGTNIDYSATHPLVAAGVSLAFLVVAAASIFSVYLSQRKVKNNNSYKFIYNTFKDEAKKKHIDEFSTSEDAEEQLAAIINHYLETILEEDVELRKKYQHIKINGHIFEITLRDSIGEQIAAEKKKPAPQTLLRKFTNKILFPAWEALSLSSFTYWILWIGGSLFTGRLDSPGIFGLPNVIGFGIPFLSGLIYPAMKIYHYYQNKRLKAEMEPQQPGQVATPELKNEVTKDACELLRRALLRCEYEMVKKSLEANIAKHTAKIAALGGQPRAQVIPFPAANANQQVPVIDKKIMSLTKGMTRKVAMTLFASATGMFVAAQYAAWIATDFLDVLFNITIAIPVANVVLGALFFAAVGTFGLYSAYMRYDKVKSFQNNPEISALNKQKEISNLEARLEMHHNNIKTHELALGRKPKPMGKTYLEEQFFTNVNRRGPDNKTFLRKAAARAFQFVNGICTGVFLGRIFLVKGNALVLPFAAAMFSTPVTIGLLVGIGVLYGAFKVYEYHKDHQEKRATLLLNQRAERIVCLKREVELAALTDHQLDLEVQAQQLETVKDKTVENLADVEMTAALKQAATSVLAHPNGHGNGVARSNGHANGNGNGHTHTNGYSNGHTSSSKFSFMAKRGNGSVAPYENGIERDENRLTMITVS